MAQTKTLRLLLISLAVLAVSICSRTLSLPAYSEQNLTQSIYYPAAGNWERRKPEDVGMDSAALNAAVTFAETQAGSMPKDFSTQVETFGRVLGPLPKTHGDTNGIIIRHGYIVAEWGDTNQIDPVYSVAKSFLSTIAGLAFDRGMIKSVKDRMKLYATDDGYASPHNSQITWENHLQQTSEWEGSMWGKNSDFVGVEEFGRGQRAPRAIKEPGTFWEYNDVRINRLSLTLLELWQKPLPLVLKTEVMDRIGASHKWEYHGYFNSQVNIKGKLVESVSGGTRWGGGLWISTRDMARFGYLFLRRGNWSGKQIISDNWIRMATTPTTTGQDYGFLWWLNSQSKQWPDAPRTSFAALGAGSNTIWIDPDDDLVVVWRWHRDRSANEFFKQILAAVKR
jgi:CubicO group peptidase (beta-lactamase class C family)